MPKFWSSMNVIAFSLLPLALVYKFVTATRRLLFRFHFLRAQKLPVPIIVVGNITAGGTGKTPVVISLANKLKNAGFTPGIISRGYRGEGKNREVNQNSVATEVGDEPILIHKKTDCPVWVGKDRPDIANSLITKYPKVNVLISDDGLQHYWLHRDFEICVVDGERLFGNTLPIPSGPMRESLSRLSTCDLVVINGNQRLDIATATVQMNPRGTLLYSLTDQTIKREPRDLENQKVTAVAAIGNPDRFFDQLASLGIKAEKMAFPDHHHYTRHEIENIENDTIVMTEKDAVKFPAVDAKTCWVLPVDAEFSQDPLNFIFQKLGPTLGQKTT